MWKGYEEGVQRQESAYTLFRAMLLYKKKAKMGICSGVEIPRPCPADGDLGEHCSASEDKHEWHQGMLIFHLLGKELGGERIANDEMKYIFVSPVIRGNKRGECSKTEDAW